jgi:hypothetical protein
MARTMIQEAKSDDKYWGQAVPIAIHILNRGLLGTNSEKTPFELWLGLDEGIFLGYSCTKHH